MSPLVFLILGAPGSGRREVVADLVEAAKGAGEKPAVLLEENEPADPAEERYPEVARWRWQDGAIAGNLPVGCTQVFLVSAGRVNPVDQVEALPDWLATQSAELGRIICVVHCALAERNPALMAWYEACVHFSDVVLLDRREGVANKWIGDFVKHFEKQFIPCLFVYVKGGRVPNPALVLEPEPRRITQIFDEGYRPPADEYFESVSPKPEGRRRKVEVDPDDQDEEADEDSPGEGDPYLVRDAAGRRRKRIPDITKYLE